MADLPTFTVTGQPLPPGDPFTADLLPFFTTDNSVDQYREWTAEELGVAQPPPKDEDDQEDGEAFAPPPPVLPPKLLPEVLVEAPSAVSTLLGGLLLLLFPQPTGPREFDEAPTPPPTKPPPKPPTTPDPIMPPNWDELGKGGDESLLDPIRAPGLPVPLPEVEMPFGEKYFDVSPPRPSIKSPIPDLWSFPYVGDDPFTASPGPGSTPSPFSPPGIDPFSPDFEPDFAPVPDRRAQPEPIGSPAPDLFGSPLPDVFGDPIGDPISPPISPPTASPNPRIPVPNAPGDTARPFADPIDAPGPDLDLDPFPLPSPEPFTPNKDACQCDKKKPKKKKRKERDVCYRGTYVQLKRGISYRRVEQVPCDTKAPKAAKTSTPRKRRKTPTWSDTLRDVFNLP